VLVCAPVQLYSDPPHQGTWPPNLSPYTGRNPPLDRNSGDQIWFRDTADIPCERRVYRKYCTCEPSQPIFGRMAGNCDSSSQTLRPPESGSGVHLPRYWPHQLIDHLWTAASVNGRRSIQGAKRYFDIRPLPLRQSTMSILGRRPARIESPEIRSIAGTSQG
jgi:hypothetical protein